MALVLWLRIWEICEGIRRGMNHTELSVLLRDSRSEKPLPHSVLRFDIDDGNRLCLKKINTVINNLIKSELTDI